MTRPKVHPLIKNFGKRDICNQIKGSNRVLVIGPMKIQKEKLEKMVKKMRPQVVMFIDGGLQHKEKITFSKKTVLIAVGDGDSSLNYEKAGCLYTLLPSKKDFSDLAFGLLCLRSLHLPRLVLLGFSGMYDERPDHLLQNLGEVYHFVQKKRVQVEMDQFTFFPPGLTKFSHRGAFSLFSFSSTQVSLRGRVEYPLPKGQLLSPFSSLGLSNYARGKVELKNKKTVVIYRVGTSII